MPRLGAETGLGGTRIGLCSAPVHIRIRNLYRVAKTAAGKASESGSSNKVSRGSQGGVLLLTITKISISTLDVPFNFATVATVERDLLKSRLRIYVDY